MVCPLSHFANRLANRQYQRLIPGSRWRGLYFPGSRIVRSPPGKRTRTHSCSNPAPLGVLIGLDPSRCGRLLAGVNLGPTVRCSMRSDLTDLCGIHRGRRAVRGCRRKQGLQASDQAAQLHGDDDLRRWGRPDVLQYLEVLKLHGVSIKTLPDHRDLLESCRQALRPENGGLPLTFRTKDRSLPVALGERDRGLLLALGLGDHGPSGALGRHLTRSWHRGRLQVGSLRGPPPW